MMWTMTATSAAFFNPAMTAPLASKEAAADGGMRDIPAAKRAMRRKVLAMRRAMSAAERAKASRAICRKIAQLPQWQAAECIAAFAPMEDEVNIWPLIEQCRRGGKTVALPRIAGQRMLEFYALQNRRMLQKNSFGIEEPPADWARVAPSQFDFVLTPAAAVDGDNCRLGYGGGFYDTLAVGLHCNAAVCVPVFRCQRTEQTPREAHDLRADMVFSE